MGERKYLCFAGSNVGAFSATYDLEAGTVIGASGATASIENYGNGWYRCLAVKSISTAGGVAVRIGTGTTATVASTGLTQSYLGDGTSGLFIWGVNVTASAYATSYIPTLSTSVTRVADAASKTGISSLINSTEGVLFLEAKVEVGSGFDVGCLSVSDGTDNNRLSILQYISSDLIRFTLRTAGATEADINITKSRGVFYKMAFAYSSNNIRVFIDGVKVGTDTSATLPAAGTFTRFAFDVGNNLYPFNGLVKQALLFPTALTDAQCIELTA
jgi:hypothetical protein